MAIFSLNEVRTEQIKNIANNNFESWPESATYGYFGGGYTNPTTLTCLISRLDFFSDTSSQAPATLPTAIARGGSVSSRFYGYFGGGEDNGTPSLRSNFRRLDFSNETVTLLPPAVKLLNDKRDFSGLSSPSYGYFSGGQTAPGPVYYCEIDRLDFSIETTSVPGNLPEAKNVAGAVSSSSYGYFVGGVIGPPASPSASASMKRIDFSNETTSEPGNLYPVARWNLSNEISSSSYGYIAGGTTIDPVESPPNIRTSTIVRLDFSNETGSLLQNTMSSARSSVVKVSSSIYGYFGGGFVPPGSTTVSTIDRLDFSNETTSLLGNDLLEEKSRHFACSGGQSNRPKGSRTYGYFGGGGPSVTCTIDRLDFSTEITSAPGNDLSQARFGIAAVSASSYGYLVGGQTPLKVCTIDRLDFSNETLSAPGNVLPEARGQLASVFNSNYGYFGCGESAAGPNVNTIDRLDFSNETTIAPSNNLSQARDALAATSSSSYGYFAGGSISPDVCTIDRIDFSNETLSLPGNDLSQAKNGLAAVSSSNYGYFAGGSGVVNTIERLDFSNETLSLPGNDLSQARRKLAAVSNSFYGYFSGGESPAAVNTIDRLDFSNETTSLPGNDLPQVIEYMAGLSN